MKQRALLFGVALLGLFVATLPNSAESQQLRFFKIGSGAVNGTYFPVAGLIAQVISNPPGSRSCEEGGNCGVPGLVATAESSGGSVANVDALFNDQVDAALAQSDVAYWSHTASGPFHKRPPNEKLCAISSTYDEQIHVVSTLETFKGSFDGLKGLRIALGKRDSGALLSAMSIFSASGMQANRDFAPMLVDFIGAEDAFRKGNIDAFVTVSGYPNKAIANLATAQQIRLVPIDGAMRDRTIANNKFFVASEIPAATYQNQNAATPTLAVPALLISRTNLAQDLVYGVTKALWTNQHRSRILEGGHPKAALITEDTALNGISIPLCPGAERFYKESGKI